MVLIFIFIILFHSAGSEQTNLEREVKQLRNLVESQRDELAEQRAMIQSLSAKFSTLESTGLTRDRRQQQAVAFTAYLDHREQEHPQSVLRFNQVLYNLGNAFNIHTGYFTAPLSGTYIFSFHIEEYDSPDLRAQLMVDGQHQISAIVAPHGTSTQGGNTVVIGLSVGQAVAITIRDEGQLYGSNTFRGTTFSGALLY